MRSIIIASAAAALVAGTASIALIAPAQAMPIPQNTTPATHFTFTTGCGAAVVTNNTTHTLTAQFNQIGENASHLRTIDVRPGGHITLHSHFSTIKVITLDHTAGTRQVTQAKVGKECSTISRPVTIHGDGRIGNPLKAETRSWGEDTHYTYQWLRNGKTITGATHPTYTPRQGTDSYKKISVKITGTRPGHTPAVRTSHPILVGPATV